jgi:hypothetical protein
VSAKVLETLEKKGALAGVKPAAYALMIDSVTPYLQLKGAREEILEDGSLQQPPAKSASA